MRRAHLDELFIAAHGRRQVLGKDLGGLLEKIEGVGRNEGFDQASHDKFTDMSIAGPRDC